MIGFAHGLRCLHQCRCHLEVRHGGELDGGVLTAGVFIADGARSHHHIAAADIEINAAASAYADEGVGTDGVELLHGDGSGRAADTCGADGDLLTQQRAGIDGILAVLCHKLRIVKMLGNGGAATGIAGQQHIAAHIALSTMDMELFFKLLHNKTSKIEYKL